MDIRKEAEDIRNLLNIIVGKFDALSAAKSVRSQQPALDSANVQISGLIGECQSLTAQNVLLRADADAAQAQNRQLSVQLAKLSADTSLVNPGPNAESAPLPLQDKPVYRNITPNGMSPSSSTVAPAMLGTVTQVSSARSPPQVVTSSVSQFLPDAVQKVPGSSVTAPVQQVTVSAVAAPAQVALPSETALAIPLSVPLQTQTVVVRAPSATNSVQVGMAGGRLTGTITSSTLAVADSPTRSAEPVGIAYSGTVPMSLERSASVPGQAVTQGLVLGTTTMVNPQIGAPDTVFREVPAGTLSPPAALSFSPSAGAMPFAASVGLASPSRRPSTPGRLASSQTVQPSFTSPRSSFAPLLAGGQAARNQSPGAQSPPQEAMQLGNWTYGTVTTQSPRFADTAPQPVPTVGCIDGVLSVPSIGYTDGVLSVVPSVGYTDGVLSVEPASRTTDKRGSITDILFDTVDRNHDGMISRTELRSALQNNLLCRPQPPLGTPSSQGNSAYGQPGCCGYNLPMI